MDESKSHTILRGCIDNYLDSNHSSSSTHSDLVIPTAKTTITTTNNQVEGQGKITMTAIASDMRTDGNADHVPVLPSTSSSLDDIRFKENNEDRMYDKDKEEKGYERILAALTDEEKRSIVSDPNLIMRHYRADKGDVVKAIKRIKYAIQWRIDSEVDNMISAVHFNFADCSTEDKNLRNLLCKEGETGKVFVRGYNKEGRAIMYFYPVRENTYNGKDNIRHLIYEIERGIACTEKNGYEKLIIIMDFQDWTMKKAAPMSVTKETIHILQECYVERLKTVYMTNTPLLFRSFWAMVKPFIDPKTRSKIVFCGGEKKTKELMEQNFDLKVLEKCAGGPEDLRAFESGEYFSNAFDTGFDE